MRNWLDHERSDADAARIHTLGNVVVPSQAALAFPILINMYKEGVTN